MPKYIALFIFFWQIDIVRRTTIGYQFAETRVWNNLYPIIILTHPYCKYRQSSTRNNYIIYQHITTIDRISVTSLIFPREDVEFSSRCCAKNYARAYKFPREEKSTHSLRHFQRCFSTRSATDFATIPHTKSRENPNW